jgi:hypothetical protein
MNLAKTIKSSTIKPMFKEQRGMASIVIVSILVVLVTLISVAFARIMNRAITNSANHSFSTAATYAAQSAINDVASYLKSGPSLPSGAGSQCNGGNSLLGGPLASDADLSGNGTTKYTCVLVNEQPADIFFQKIPPNESKIVRLNTTTSPGRYLVSWQANDNGTYNRLPAGGKDLLDETTWNTNRYVPMLRLTLYPIAAGSNIASIQSASKTVFLYPLSGAANVPNYSYASLQDSSILNVGCTKTETAGTFTGSADLACNLIIDQLGATTASYFYARFTPIYNFADVKVKVNDSAGGTIYFSNVQAIVDATAQSGTVSKRLQARLNISNTGGNNFDVDPADNEVPEQSIRSAQTLCKRYDTGPGFLSIDDISGTCLPGSNITFTPPFVNLSLDRHLINSGESVNIQWTVANSVSCAASNAWSGSKDPTTGTHSQNSGALAAGTYTYTIVCTGPDGQKTPPSSDTVKVQSPASCTVSKANPAINENVTYTGSGGDGSYTWAGGGTPATGSGATFTTKFSAAGSYTVRITSAGQTASCPVVVIPSGGSSGGDGCLNSAPSPSPGDPLPDPCIRDLIYRQWEASGVVTITIYASHCYAVFGSSPGTLSGGWNRSPNDNSSDTNYSLSGFPASGGTLTITCGNGSTTVSASINIPPRPSGGPCTPCPSGYSGTCWETTGCASPPPQYCPQNGADCTTRTHFGCDWGDGQDGDYNSNGCWIEGGTWSRFCQVYSIALNRPVSGTYKC